MTSRQKAEQKLQEMTSGFIEKLKPILFAPVSMQQMVTAQDVPAKGPVWVSRTVFEKPEGSHELGSVLKDAFRALDFGGDSTYDFTIEDVDVQWTAYRPVGKEKEPEPEITEHEKFNGMMKDVPADTVILYAHGGFYYTGSPSSVRATTLALARETGGRCLVPDYRLAPQCPFPAAVVDLFLAYLSLLHPGKDAMHKPVSAQNIVFAGDSSGGNLVLSLLALLQHLRDHAAGRVRFRDQWIDVPLPAGVATLYPHCDHAMSFASHIRNRPYDIFILDLLPHLQPNYPSCDIWPTKPPREDIYADARTLLHPLVSVAIAPAWSANNMPPMFIATGQEKLTDEQYYLAKRAEKAGATVQFYQYDALPHSFASFFPRLPQSKHVLSQWGAFCRDVVKRPGDLESVWVRYAADDVEFKGMELESPVDVEESVEVRRGKMREKLAVRKVWRGPTETAML
ncbi:alpha/beta-hydrolase [Paraphaeosphaeria sporulosa]|uniref:Alpha/beta-hydrolase n=1 Tax=Paraphaeosphaeria sporulosa TaxID=1460663 RepID=A0A177CEM8_9PLEO|nr:alpha/beta-hydrolase [Paraphaeosphaeria sporulosa]OAG06093.1 alpha/beta-hydrolase [Paraphaeosphaeria sporulosa]